MVWIAIREALSRESSLLDAHGNPIYRPRLDPNFAASFVIFTILAVIAVAYGAYRYYKTPFPTVVSSSSKGFKENYKGSDVYTVVNLKNFSDSKTKVVTETYVTAFDERLPAIPDPNYPEVRTVELAPFEAEALRFEMRFFDNQGLLNAYRENQLKVHVAAKYNNGTRDVTYNFVGRIDSHSARDCCLGNVDIVEQDTN